MKLYDERFAEKQTQIRELYYDEQLTMKKISGMVEIPLEPLRIRMNEVMQIRKTTYEPCKICNKPVAVSMYTRHMKSHLWAITNKHRCRWCKSQHVVKNGFTTINGVKKQNVLCRSCNRISMLKATGSRDQKRTDGLCNIAKILKKSGYTYRGIVDFIKRNYKMSIDEKTAWNWVNTIIQG